MRRVILLVGLASCLLPALTRAESPAPVEHRLYAPGGRFSLSASLGLSLFNGLTRTWTLTAGAGYDFNNWLGLDLRLGGALFSHTSLADRIGQRLLQQPPTGDTVDDLSDLWTMRAFSLLGVRLAPVYGKFNLGPDFPACPIRSGDGRVNNSRPILSHLGLRRTRLARHGCWRARPPLFLLQTTGCGCRLGWLGDRCPVALRLRLDIPTAHKQQHPTQESHRQRSHHRAFPRENCIVPATERPKIRYRTVNAIFCSGFHHVTRVQFRLTKQARSVNLDKITRAR